MGVSGVVKLLCNIIDMYSNLLRYDSRQRLYSDVLAPPNTAQYLHILMLIYHKYINYMVPCHSY